MTTKEKKPKFITTELGQEKHCYGCDEYYPADTDFFFASGRYRKDGSHGLDALCKACRIEHKRNAA